jgi:isoleucyl-tRNA synthetase
VLADYVTTDSGTGAVHTAPGHGAEDYQTGLKYGLEIYCPVGDDGKYLDDGRVPADLVGLTTLETVEDLAAKKPAPPTSACSRSSPTPARCSPRRSIRTATRIAGAPRPRSSSAPSTSGSSRSTRRVTVRSPSPKSRRSQRQGGWIPAWGEARIRGAVESRPDWCISRQRSWGVPIIAFYGPDKKPYLDAGVVRAVADKVATKAAISGMTPNPPRSSPA